MPSINDIPSGVFLPQKTLSIPAATTTFTVTAAQAGTLFLIQSTGGLAITPPAATGTFNVYEFLVVTTITGGTFSIDPKAGNASDVFQGSIYGGTTAATGGTWITAATSNFLQMSGSTTGGLAGSWVKMLDVATNKWMIQGVIVTSGTAASPFSNH